MDDILKRAMTSSEACDEIRKQDGPCCVLDQALETMRRDMEKADREYTEAVGYAREFMSAVRFGKTFDHNDAGPVVESFIDSVFHNEAATAAICKLKACDEYTFTHGINVAIFAVILGKKLGFSRERLKTLGLAGIFHDVGKALIPQDILNKPDKLTDQEMEVMKTHPLQGYKILKEQEDVPTEVLRVCLEHHERYDGSGYPRQLKGDDISEMSRVIAVVDVYDALTSKRVYRDPLPPGQVLGMMYQWRVGHYYPGVLESFIKCLGVYPVGTLMRLGCGDHAVVLYQNEDDLLHPVVRVVFDEKFRHKTPATLVDLSEDGGKADYQIMELVNPSDRNIDVYRLLH